MTETVLVIGLVGVLVLGSVLVYGDNIRALFSSISNQLAAVDGPVQTRLAVDTGRAFGWPRNRPESLGKTMGFPMLDGLMNEVMVRNSVQELAHKHHLRKQQRQEKIAAALDLLGETKAGEELAALLKDKDVPIKIRYSNNRKMAVFIPEDEVIIFNSRYLDEMPLAFVASLLAHEALHADYLYHPDRWIEKTKRDFPRLRDHNIGKGRLISIDQEFRAHQVGTAVYAELRDRYGRYRSGDDWITNLAMGEDYAKILLRSDPGYADLPEY